jgi:hypothetical protein
MNGEIIAPARPQRITAIKGLVPSLPERGKIKIGEKGEVRKSKGGAEFQPPKKLDHFVVTTLDRGPDGNFIRDDEIHRLLGEKPTEIPIRLLYDDPTVNFPTRYACYVGRTLWCHGDGESAQRLDAEGVARPVECPCPRKEPAYAGKDKCKMNGVLSALIEGGSGIGGVWKFRTTSYNSIVGILSSLAFIRSVTGGVLANIPLRLVVRPKRAAAPDGTQVLIYVVGIEFSGDIGRLQNVAHMIALDRARTHVSIKEIETEARRLLALAPPNAPLPGDVASDVVEEFYPEQAEAALREDAATAVDALDEFAAKHSRSAGGEIIDAETGEVFDRATLERDARSAAGKGTAHFREHLRAIGRERRDLLRDLIGTADAPGELTTLARNTDEAMRAHPADDEGPVDAFGLPPYREAAPEIPRPASNPDQPQTNRKEGHAVSDPGGSLSAPAVGNRDDTPPAGERPRDDDWWNQEHVTIPPRVSGREFQAEMHRRLREARNWAEVERLREDNPAIDTLDRGTKQDILNALADRERELRAMVQR